MYCVLCSVPNCNSIPIFQCHINGLEISPNIHCLLYADTNTAKETVIYIGKKPTQRHMLTLKHLTWTIYIWNVKFRILILLSSLFILLFTKQHVNVETALKFNIVICGKQGSTFVSFKPRFNLPLFSISSTSWFQMNIVNLHKTPKKCPCLGQIQYSNN